jgi:hypothetical protein
MRRRNQQLLNGFGLSLLFLFCLDAQAAETLRLRVKVPQALVYSEASTAGPAAGKVSRNKVLLSDSVSKNGFLRLQSRRDQKLWIQKASVEILADDESQSGDSLVESGPDTTPFKRWRLDFGFATGTAGGSSYYEANAALSYYFYHWLYWKNAPFYRSVSNSGGSYFGLDSSLEVIHYFEIDEGIYPFVNAGGGYRLMTNYASAPFVEGGLGIQLKGLRIGGNVKYVMNSITSRYENEMLYSIVLSGSTAF